MANRTENHKNNPKPLKKCHVCGKSFCKTYSLSRHLKLHTGVKEFRCHVCSYDFIQKSDLKRHLATHSDEKNFVCEYGNCGKSFRTQRNMHSHQVGIHIRGRIFECKICHMQFKFFNTLRLHRNRVHDVNKKVFECDYCGKLMHVKQYLRSHLTRHILKAKDKLPLVPRTLHFTHPRYFSYLRSHETPVDKAPNIEDVNVGPIFLEDVVVKPEKLEEDETKFDTFDNNDNSEERQFLWSFLPYLQQMGSEEKKSFKEEIRALVEKVLTL